MGKTLMQLAPGSCVALGLGVLSMLISVVIGGPVMLYALLLGMPLVFLYSRPGFAKGIDFSAKSILRIGVALLGARITVSEIGNLGLPTMIMVLTGILFTIGIGWAVGRWLALRSDQSVLSASSVAICGASAALAVSAALPKHDQAERNLIVTVVCVTTISTVVMLLYPAIMSVLGISDRTAGIFIGATIHDVAQVVGAGYMVSEESGEVATLVKLMRVACLVPTVVIVGLIFREASKSASAANGEAMATQKRPPLLPMFLIGFIVLACINSAGLIPTQINEGLAQLSKLFLVVSVAALGMKTSFSDFKSVGPWPVIAMIAQTILLALFAAAAIHFFEIA